MLSDKTAIGVFYRVEISLEHNKPHLSKPKLKFTQLVYNTK